MTMEKANAELIFPDERQPVTKISEVTKAVTELRAGSASVPADRHDRTGDFQKLLLAGTADRSEIFRKMFHTEIYQELQNRLRRKQRRAGKRTMKRNEVSASTWTMLYARRMPDGKKSLTG